jgi:hypothetical protein
MTGTLKPLPGDVAQWRYSGRTSRVLASDWADTHHLIVLPSSSRPEFGSKMSWWVQIPPGE